MSRKKIEFVLRIVVSLGLILILLSRIDLQHLWRDIKTIDIPEFILGLIVFGCFVLLWSIRWSLFLRSMAVNVSFYRIIKTLLIGLFLSLFLPTIVGADVGRIVELSRTQKDRISIVSTVLLDRLVGLLSLAVTAFVALLIQGYRYVGDDIILAVVGILIVLLVGLLLFFSARVMRRFRWVLRLPLIQRIQNSIRDLYSSLYKLRQEPRLFISTFLISMMMTGLEITSVFILAKAIDAPATPVHFFVFLPIIWIIITVPISIGGLGLRETAFVFFFSQVGMESSHAILISLLYYSFFVITGSIGGLLLLADSFTMSSESRE